MAQNGFRAICDLPPVGSLGRRYSRPARTPRRQPRLGAPPNRSPILPERSRPPAPTSVHVASTDTWEQIRDQLRQAVPASAYDMWLRELEPRELTPQHLVVAAPDRRARWVADRFGRLLQAVAAVVLGEDVEVDVVGASEPRPATAPTGAGSPDHASTSPRYTFEQFVIGEGNRLAHAAALAVAELPGHSYNPLFICGPPGVGKTHLLHSIAAYVQACSGISVRCTTTDSFVTGFVQALQTGSIDRFKAAHRGADVLLVDDVQFLEDKARTEEEFFHTFNSIYEGGGQLVLTSDRPPRDIETLEKRLQERFEAGLVAEIAAPDFHTRVTILRKWARQEGLPGVTDDVLEWLAQHVDGNVRALQGALTRVVALASLMERPVDAELVEEVIRHPGGGRARKPTIADAQRVACEEFGVALEDLVSASRAPRVAWPRQLAMFLARAHTDATLPAIGRAFGGRDHTTVLYACRRVAERAGADHVVHTDIERLATELCRGGGDRDD
jgi:chromosomal replication initiator protein